MNNIDKLAKALKDSTEIQDKKKTTPYDTNAKVVRVDGNTAWVSIAGGVPQTPATMVVNAKEGDEVRVRVGGGKAYVTGNATAPPTDDTHVLYVTKEAVDYITELKEKDITVRSITTATGYIDDLHAKNITTENLQATTGYIKDLTSEHITAKDITADHATVDTLDANYAQIDMANVNNAWIENGTIKKAEVFDENVFDLSGNRATLSRIDASKINVANLRADNLVVRRINGQPVVGGYTLIDSNSSGYASKNPQALGWYEFVNAQWVLSTDTTVDMTKAYYQEGNEVSLYDQTYIDGLEDDLQQQIDGAVETYTGTVVPTLVNWPYTDWYDTSVTPVHDERAKHVGDIYYVVNSAADENGYCYRFAYDNTSHAYSWVLIKDSDVTKALSDISELQTFESTTTSWMDETDEGIETIRTNYTALSGRVDDVEDTANAALPASTFESFESTTFTDLVDEVDEQSTTMTNMTTRLGLNADGTGTSTDIWAKESALEQTVDGISTRVGKTETKLIGMYATSSTAAGTAAKVATITPTLPSGATWELSTGTIITVKFTNANTTSSPTLNVNSKGAKAIKTYANGNLSEAEYKWTAGSTFTFVYNGTNWLMQDSSVSVRMNSAETSITQNAQQIQSKASQSSVDSLSGRVSTAESTITQQATAIEAKVSKNGVIASINASVEEQGGSAVKISADKVNITGTAVFNAVDADATAKAAMLNSELEIGGRNLLKDSSNLVDGWAYNQATVSNGEATISPTQTGDMRIYQIPANSYFTPQANTTYTLSVEAKSSNGAKLGFVPNWAGAGSKTFTVTSDWKRYSWTFVSSSAGTGSTTISAAGNVTGVTLMVRKPKLEIGNKATDWTPAPEDVQAEIDAKKSVHTLDTAYSYTYANILTYSAEGYSGNWDLASPSTTTGVKVGDTVRLKVTVSNMSNAAVYVVGTVTNVASGRTDRLTMTSHGLDTTIIDGGNILTNSIGANQIKANSINATKLAVGDWTNLVTVNENDPNSVASSSVAVSGGYITKTTASNQYMAFVYRQANSFRTGDELYVEFYAKAASATTARFSLYGYDSSGTFISGCANSLLINGSSSLSIGTSDTFFSGTIKLSATQWDSAALYDIDIDNYATSKVQIYVKKLIVRRKSGGELIVDGAITVGSMSQDAQNKVLNSNVQVGGKNLLRNSANMGTGWTMENGTNSNGVVTLTRTNASTRVYQLPANGCWTWKAGQTYVASVEAKGNAGGEVLQMTANGGSPTAVDPTSTLTTSWKRYYRSFTITADASTGSMSFGTITDNSTIQVRYPKLEIGNKATDWTAAPEDELNDNLLIDSQKMTAWYKASGASGSTTDEFGVFTLTGDSSTWNSNFYSRPTIRTSILDGTPLWLSFEYKASAAITDMTVVLAGTAATEGTTGAASRTKYSGGRLGSLPAASSWTRKVVSMPTTLSELVNGSGDVNSLFVQFYNRTASTTLKIRKVKLEHGSSATNWTPSPEEQKTYITRIDGAGIRIHPSNTENNSVVIDGSGMEVFKGGTTDQYSVAKYGDTVRIGKTANEHVEIGSSAMSYYNGATRYARFGGWTQLGTDSAVHLKASADGLEFAGANGRNVFDVHLSGTNSNRYISERFNSTSAALAGVPVTGTEIYARFADSTTSAHTLYVFTAGTNGTFTYNKGSSNYTATYTASTQTITMSGSNSPKVVRVSYTTAFPNLYTTIGTRSFGDDETDSATAGMFSLAQGLQCYASGEASTALNYGTKAAGNYQTAIGKWNAEDATSLFIIGKGSSANSRANAFSVGSNGTVYVNGTSVHSSDRRLKEHISYLGDEAVEFIDGLKPAHYIKDGKKHVGFYAQDVKDVDKWDCMLGEEMNGYMTLSYMDLIAPLVTYCQKLEERINKLESEDSNE